MESKRIARTPTKLQENLNNIGESKKVRGEEKTKRQKQKKDKNDDRGKQGSKRRTVIPSIADMAIAIVYICW